MFSRKVRRNILKKTLGTNKIKEAWRKSQIEKFGGEKQYNIMRNKYTKRRQSLFEKLIKEKLNESNI